MLLVELNPVDKLMTAVDALVDRLNIVLLVVLRPVDKLLTPVERLSTAVDVLVERLSTIFTAATNCATFTASASAVPAATLAI